MKKKIIITILIDLTLAFVLALAFVFAAYNASGMLFPNNSFFDEESFLKTTQILLKIKMGFLLLYVVVILVFRNSVGWLATQKGKFAKALKLIFANIIDFSVILLITLLIDYVLQPLLYYDIFVLLFVIFAVYNIISCLFVGVTFGKWCFGIKLNTSNRTAIVKYIFAKIACVLVFPVVLFRCLGIIDPYALFMNIVFCFLFFQIFSFTITNKTIWAYFSKSAYVFQNPNLKLIFYKLLCLFLFIIIGLFSIKYNNNKIYANEKGSILGFNYPFEFKKYLNDEKMQPYINFLSIQNHSPKEYILKLFERYDIVVLQETWHGESTQWDLIFDIVSDTAFINNVGNIFSEYGYVGQQQKLNVYLNTIFPNDTILEQETACLMYYMSGAFFYFIKNLNLLNSELTDSLKVRHHFCDMQIDCEDIVSFIITKREIMDSNRDSLMAKVTIDWYNEQVAKGKRHKCLIITNYRHAFGYAGGVDYVKKQPNIGSLTQGNQGQYIWEHFPDKTATVMQWQYVYPRTLFLPVSRPIHKGKWDFAFENNQNIPVGFDLKNTPFGDDYFDMFPLRGAKIKLKYQDIFTGMIFNNPYSEMKEVIHPFRQHAILQAIKTKNIDLQDPQNKYYLYFSQYFDDEPIAGKFMSDAFIFFSMYIPIILYIFLSLLSLLGMLWYFFSKIINSHGAYGKNLFR